LKGKAALLSTITQHAKTSPITLLYSAKDGQHNQAVALRSFLVKRIASRKQVGREKQPSLIVTRREKIKAGLS
jgi:hypothetical protein